MNKLIIFSFIMVISSCSTGVVENNREIASTDTSCLNLVEKILTKKETNVLDAIKRKIVGTDYSIRENELFFEDKKVGDIEILNPRYLFEWQDKDSHKAWMANGGISREEMDLFLESEPQMYGRGYYISINPTDSESYGTHLTIFEVKRPIAILKGKNRLPIFWNSEEYTKELRDLGFAGFRGTKTWFNIINESYLSRVKKISGELLEEILDKDSNVSSFSLKKLKSKNSIASGVKFPSIQVAMTKFKKRVPLSNLEKAVIVDHYKYLPQDFIAEFGKADEIKYFFETFDISFLNGFYAEMAPEYRKSYIKFFQQVFEKMDYPKSFFDLYDLSDIAKAKKKGELQKLISIARKQDEILETIDLTKIKNHKDFQVALKKLYGLDFKLRYTEESTTYEISSLELSSNTRNVLVNASSQVGKNNALCRIESFTRKNMNESLKSIVGKKLVTDINSRPIADSVKDEMIMNLLYDKLFDEDQFQRLAYTANPTDYTYSISSVHRAFVSINPYGKDNQLASKLYYKWLIANAYPDEAPSPLVLSHKAEIFGKNLEDTLEDFSWYMDRLWVLAGQSDKEISERAQRALNKGKIYQNYLIKYPFLNN